MAFIKIRQNLVYLNALAVLLEISPHFPAKNAHLPVALALRTSDLNVSAVFPLPTFTPLHV